MQFDVVVDLVFELLVLLALHDQLAGLVFVVIAEDVFLVVAQEELKKYVHILLLLEVGRVQLFECLNDLIHVDHQKFDLVMKILDHLQLLEFGGLALQLELILKE